MPDAPGSDLHALLGADPALPADRLRMLYESQMSAAVRGNDNSRALALSRAFDAAPAALRRGMYSASVPEDRWIPPAGRPASRFRRRRTRRRLPGDDARWRTPVIVLVAFLVVVGLLWSQGALDGLLP